MANLPKHKSSQAIAAGQRPSTRDWRWFGAALGLIIVLIAAAAVLFNSSDQPAAGQVQAGTVNLVGDWVRPDGGYVIRISRIEPDGTVQAAYFNPNPIHVAQATASLKNNAVVLFIKLQDAGYPGSTYDLVYKPEEDILQGIYFQAQIQEHYNVLFQRINDTTKRTHLD